MPAMRVRIHPSDGYGNGPRITFVASDGTETELPAEKTDHLGMPRVADQDYTEYLVPLLQGITTA